MSATGNALADAEIRQRMVAFLPRLRRFCRTLTGNQDHGDDLVQATFERTLSRIDQWQPGTSLENWMFRIARNIHIDAFRAARARGIAVEIEQAADLAGADNLAHIESRSKLDAVRAAMDALPIEQREALALVVLDGRSYREAADALDVPIGTIMSRVARARQAIGKVVRQEVEQGAAS